MGAPEFAVPTLREIVLHGHHVAAVYTRAPQPGGRRGLAIQKTPVHRAAESLDIPVFTPATLKDEDVQKTFQEHCADVGFVVAYGLLLPVAILTAPRFGFLNIHASLLPRWRGAAPIQRAIMAGDHWTGIDLMRMEAGLDTGPIGLREVVPIAPGDTAGDLTKYLARVAAQTAIRGLNALESGGIDFKPQPSEGATYARKIDKSEIEIDWAKDAVSVRNHIHGLSPMPGAYSTLVIGGSSNRIKILRVETVTGSGQPGSILDDALTVACADAAIRVLEAQRAGRTVVSGRELMLRESVPIGAAFRRSTSIER